MYRQIIRCSEPEVMSKDESVNKLSESEPTATDQREVIFRMKIRLKISLYYQFVASKMVKIFKIKIQKTNKNNYIYTLLNIYHLHSTNQCIFLWNEHEPTVNVVNKGIHYIWWKSDMRACLTADRFHSTSKK